MERIFDLKTKMDLVSIYEIKLISVLVLCGNAQLFGRFGPTGSQGLPANRTGYSANASQDHRHCRSPFFFQKPQFQVSCRLPAEFQFDWSFTFLPNNALLCSGCSTLEASAPSGRSGSIASKTWRPSSFAWPCPNTIKCCTKMKPP